MQAENRAGRPAQARPPRGEHEVTAVHSTAAARAALLQPAGFVPDDGDDIWTLDDEMPVEPTVGPAGHSPILTPDTVRRGPGWTADFVFNALSALHDSVVLWPELLHRPFGTQPQERRSRYWSWLRIDAGERLPLQAVGYRALDALMAACWLCPETILRVIDDGQYIRVPFLLIGPDRRADFPVLYRAPLCGTITLHTMFRRSEDIRRLRACTLAVHIDR